MIPTSPKCWPSPLALVGLLALAACGKSRPAHEDEAIRNLQKDNPFVAQFLKLYPHSMGFFTNYDDDFAPTTWHSRIGLQGRYVLEMKMELVLDRDRKHAEKTLAPRFSLFVVDSLVKESNGAIHLKFKGPLQVDFGVDLWRALVEKGGDLSVLGIQAGADPPLPDFEKYWAEF